MKTLDFLKLLKKYPIFAENEVMIDDAIEELELLYNNNPNCSYKIELIHEDLKYVIEQTYYQDRECFLNYGNNYFERNHGTTHNQTNELAYCKCYIMNNDNDWVEITIPVIFFK